MPKRLVKQLSGSGVVYRGDAVIQQSAQYRIDLFRNFIPSGVDASEIAGLFTLAA